VRHCVVKPVATCACDSAAAAVCFRTCRHLRLVAICVCVAALLSIKNANQRLTFFGFYFPKIIFIAVFFVVAVVMYSYIVFMQQQDPLYDWYCSCACAVAPRVRHVCVTCATR
jgi:hypothetical protein